MWDFVCRVPAEFSQIDRRGIVRHSTKVRVNTDRTLNGKPPGSLTGLISSWKPIGGRLWVASHLHRRHPCLRYASPSATRGLRRVALYPAAPDGLRGESAPKGLRPSGERSLARIKCALIAPGSCRPKRTRGWVPDVVEFSKARAGGTVASSSLLWPRRLRSCALVGYVRLSSISAGYRSLGSSHRSPHCRSAMIIVNRSAPFSVRTYS